MRKTIYSTFIMFMLCGITYAAGTYLYTYHQRRVDYDEILSQTLNVRPYMIDTGTANTVYMCYQGGTGIKLIVRMTTESSLITIEKSYATWANRATATYSPIND